MTCDQQDLAIEKISRLYKNILKFMINIGITMKIILIEFLSPSEEKALRSKI